MTIRQKLLTIILILVGVYVASAAAYFLIRAPISRINSEEVVLETLRESIRNETIQLNRLTSAQFPDQLDAFMKSNAATAAAFRNLDTLKLLPAASPSIRQSLDVIRNLKAALDKGASDFLLTVTNVQGDAGQAGLDQTRFTLFSLTTYDVLKNKEQSDAVTADVNQFLSQLNTLSLIMIKSADVIDQQSGAIDSQVTQVARRSDLVSIAIVIILFGVTVLVALLMTGRIVRTVRSIESSIGQMGSGDLTVAFSVSTSDEIGRLSDNLNGFVGSLRDSVNAAQLVSGENLEMKESLIVSTEQTSASAEQISSSAESVDRQVANLSDNLDRSGEAVRRIAENIRGLNEQIHEQTTMVEESTASVTQMITSIENVSRITDLRRDVTERLVNRVTAGEQKMVDTFSVVKQITGSIDSIKDITGIIGSISAQTNLLAMNAAIEAAHAGEAGLGFSVVADEIRKLSEAASNNSKEISRILRGIVDRITEAGTSGEQMTNAFHEISAETQELARSLAEIFSSMSELRSGSDQILQAMTSLRDSSAQVKDGSSAIRGSSEDIEETMQVVRRVSSEVRGAMAEISGGMHEISTSVQNVLGIAEKLGSLGESLNQELRQFKTT